MTIHSRLSVDIVIEFHSNRSQRRGEVLCISVVRRSVVMPTVDEHDDNDVAFLRHSPDFLQRPSGNTRIPKRPVIVNLNNKIVVSVKPASVLRKLFVSETTCSEQRYYLAGVEHL